MDTVWWADQFPPQPKGTPPQSINTKLLLNGSASSPLLPLLFLPLLFLPLLSPSLADLFLVSSGHSRPVRYYSYFPQALELTKDLILTAGCYRDDEP
jgi:hypothetical protein